MSAFGKCPICNGAIKAKLAIGRKSGKRSLALACPTDARHFRGFINDREFVERNLSHHLSIKDSESDQANGR